MIFNIVLEMLTASETQGSRSHRPHLPFAPVSPGKPTDLSAPLLERPPAAGTRRHRVPGGHVPGRPRAQPDAVTDLKAGGEAGSSPGPAKTRLQHRIEREDTGPTAAGRHLSGAREAWPGAQQAGTVRIAVPIPTRTAHATCVYLSCSFEEAQLPSGSAGLRGRALASGSQSLSGLPAESI